MWETTAARPGADMLDLSARNVRRACVLLDELLATFPERPDLAGEVHRLENEADQIVRQALASLFAQGIDPIVVIRWKAIYDTLEGAVDACETVVNVLEGIAFKRASHR
jgi:uncharacterized protein Yka (UPF0111/DUF47 family)